MSQPSAAQQFEIRLAGPGDETTVAALLLEAFEPYREQYTPGGFDFTTAKAEEIRGRFDEGQVWLAVDGDQAVATVSGLAEPEGFYVRSMAVSPRVQGRGVGQTLMNTLESHAREQGFKRVFLYTTFVLPGARPLYEKLGFTVVRETAPEEWFDMGGIEMEKFIGE